MPPLNMLYPLSVRYWFLWTEIALFVSLRLELLRCLLRVSWRQMTRHARVIKEFVFLGMPWDHVSFQIAFVRMLFLTNLTKPVAVGEMVFKFMLVSQVCICKWLVTILEITHCQLPWVQSILIRLVAWNLWVLVLKVKSWFRFLILILCLRVSTLPSFRMIS